MLSDRRWVWGTILGKPQAGWAVEKVQTELLPLRPWRLAGRWGGGWASAFLSENGEREDGEWRTGNGRTGNRGRGMEVGEWRTDSSLEGWL